MLWFNILQYSKTLVSIEKFLWISGPSLDSDWPEAAGATKMRIRSKVFEIMVLSSYSRATLELMASHIGHACPALCIPCAKSTSSSETYAIIKIVTTIPCNLG